MHTLITNSTEVQLLTTTDAVQ